MISKDEAIALIEGRLEKQARVIVALDGMSCSGKPTWARELAEKFSGSVVHMDDFFLPAKLRTAERYRTPGGNVHHERFAVEVLPRLRSPEPFGYRVFDCSTMDYGGTATIRGGKGYQLVKIGRSRVTVGGVLQLATLPARYTRFFLGRCFDPKHPDQQFDFYLSAKDGGDGKSLLVDRLVLAKVKGGKKSK